MRTGIVRLTFGSTDVADITEAEFEQIRTAKRGLLTALCLEERFDVVLENYAEFEADLLNRSLRHLVFFEHGWSSFQGHIHTINRRLVNLLSSTRLYKDHLLHELHTLYSKGSEVASGVKAAMSAEYDSCLSYRAMEAIRNHLQHRDIAVNHVTLRMVRDERADDVSVGHSASPCLDIAALQKNPKIKQLVVSELAAIGQKVCLTPLVREYIASLGRVQERVRTLMDADIRRWDELISSTMARGAAEFGDTSALAVVRLIPVGDEEEEHDAEDLFLEFIERRRSLESRRLHAAHLATHYVSGRANLDGT